MTITLKNEEMNKKSSRPKVVLKNDSKRVPVTQERSKCEYISKHSHAGFIIAIIILAILVIAGPIGMFFWAKGIGWDEGRESAKKEYYDYGYGIGYEEGKTAGWENGYQSGKSWGYDKGFEDARNCAQRIAMGYLRDSIYTCYNHMLGH